MAERVGRREAEAPAAFRYLRSKAAIPLTAIDGRCRRVGECPPCITSSTREGIALIFYVSLNDLLKTVGGAQV